MFGVPSLPVMVRLHGGGFTTGSGNAEINGPDFIVQERVVLVTINYRLSMFGRYCSFISHCPIFLCSRILNSCYHTFEIFYIFVGL